MRRAGLGTGCAQSHGLRCRVPGTGWPCGEPSAPRCPDCARIGAPGSSAPPARRAHTRRCPRRSVPGCGSPVPATHLAGHGRYIRAGETIQLRAAPRADVTAETSANGPAETSAVGRPAAPCPFFAFLPDRSGGAGAVPRCCASSLRPTPCQRAAPARSGRARPNRSYSRGRGSRPHAASLRERGNAWSCVERGQGVEEGRRREMPRGTSAPSSRRAVLWR